MIESLVNAAELIEEKMAINREVLSAQASALRQGRQQCRGLLERAFHGVVQTEGGLVLWGSNGFWALFSDLKPRDELRQALAERDRAKFDAACRSTLENSKDVGPRFERVIATCNAGASNLEFDCELVIVPPPIGSMAEPANDTKRMLLGVRCIGEARPANAARAPAIAAAPQAKQPEPTIPEDDVVDMQGSVWQGQPAASRSGQRLSSSHSSKSSKSNWEEWDAAWAQLEEVQKRERLLLWCKAAQRWTHRVQVLMENAPNGHGYSGLEVACYEIHTQGCQQPLCHAFLAPMYTHLPGLLWLRRTLRLMWSACDSNDDLHGVELLADAVGWMLEPFVGKSSLVIAPVPFATSH